MMSGRTKNIAAERLAILSRELKDLKRAADAAMPDASGGADSKWDHVDRLLSQVAEEHFATVERLERLSREQEHLDNRLLDIENSVLFRSFRRVGQALSTARAHLGQALLRSPIHALYVRLATQGYDPNYRLWSMREAATLTQRYAEPAEGPLISVIMPVYNARREWLAAAIQSVRHQTYPQWQLCICDDGSTEPWIPEYLSTQAEGDQRITFVRQGRRGGISSALNRAAEEARGSYVAFLDHDDTLPSYALACVAEMIRNSSADLLYSDEDRLDGSGQRVGPVFKPDWSPSLLLSIMYVGHLVVAARDLLDRLGWFRPKCDGSQDYDLLLRAADAGAIVHHIPHILYHQRKHTGSTAENPAAKPYTHAAGRAALQDSLDRRGWDMDVVDGRARNVYDLRSRVREQPLVSVIICTKTLRLLRACVRSLERTATYRPLEIIVVQQFTGNDAALTDAIDRLRCTRVPFCDSFNSPAMNNAGAATARGEVLIFLNDDVSGGSPAWLETLVADALRPDVGVGGARLLYPRGTIQHAGITLGISDGCGHAGRGERASSYWPWLDYPRDVSAVTGACLAIRRTVFNEVGGFREMFPSNYGDVDLCIRVRQRGLSVIVDPRVTLRHSECCTRTGGTSYVEREAWFREWHIDTSFEDPFYNPNLDKTERIRLRLAR